MNSPTYSLSILTLGVVLCLRTPTQSAEAAKTPGPEHQKLTMGVGCWNYTEASEETPFGAAGTSTHTAECRMLPGGFVTEEKGQGVTPEGPYSWVGLTGYDSEAGYFGYSTDSSGAFARPGKDEAGKGKLSGNTWTWTWKQEAKGKTYQCRSVNEYSADHRTQTYVWTYSEDGNNWKPWLKGKGVKTDSDISAFKPWFGKWHMKWEGNGQKGWQTFSLQSVAGGQAVALETAFAVGDDVVYRTYETCFWDQTRRAFVTHGYQSPGIATSSTIFLNGKEAVIHRAGSKDGKGSIEVAKVVLEGQDKLRYEILSSYVEGRADPAEQLWKLEFSRIKD